jgi:hypothetical protein
MSNSSRIRSSVVAVFSVLVFALYGCGGGGNSVPDTSGIKLSLTTHRFDQDLFGIDTSNMQQGLTTLKTQYPDFLDYFLDTLMAYNIYGNYADTTAGVREGLKPFLTFKDFKELQDTINKHYPDTREQDKQLTEAFKLLRHYFPHHPVPRVIYLNLGLSKWPAFPLDSNTMCVALDMFLGDQFPHYMAVGIHDYMLTHTREAYLPVSVFAALYRGYHPWKPQEKTLIELMLDKGKEQYFLHQILPTMPDSVLFGFRESQVLWCNANEALIYNFFIQNQLLYNKEATAVMPYVTDGPFARGLEPVSSPQKQTPGNIGTWLGYKMIAAYMAQNPAITLSQLLSENTEASVLLAKAKYKPR